MKLIENLKLIHKANKELDRLERFVSSSYHNKGQQILPALLNELLKSYPYYNIDEKRIYKEITNRTTFSIASWRSYCSQLNGLIEQFLIQEQLQENTFFQQQLLAKAYIKKGSFSNFLKAQANTEKKIKEGSSISVHQLATLGTEAIFHTENKNLEDDTLLKNTLLNVERTSMLEQLKLHAELLSRTQILANDEYSKLNLLLSQAYIENYFHFLPIEIYVKILEFSIQNDTPKYSETVDLFTKNIHLFTETEQLQLFSLIQNFNIRQINAGQKREQEMCEMYLLGIQVGIFQEGNSMSEVTFLNIANNFSMLHKFEEHEKFVSKFSKSLPKENTKVILLLAKVNFYFYQFENTKSTHFLRDIQVIASEIDSLSGNLMYNLLLRMSLCKTYYELLLTNDSMLQLIESEIAKFKSFIKRKKISTEKIALYNNFFVILSELIKLTSKPNSEAKAKLQERCIAMNPLGNKAYLLRKIGNL